MNDVELVSRQKQQLTELDRVEDTIQSGLSTDQQGDDPYPDTTPADVMSREYRIDSFNITAGATYTLMPYHLLMQNQTLKDFAKRYRYMSAGLKLRFELMTNPMQYGAIAVSWLPYMAVGDTEYADIYAQSQSSMHLLDVGQQESLDVALPYLRPQLYYDLNQPTEHVLDWRVLVHGLIIDTITAGAPPQVQINVFASFIGPHLAGFVPQNPVFQSRTDNRKIAARTLASIGTLAKSVFETTMFIPEEEMAFTDPGEAFSLPTENAKLDLLGNIAIPSVSSSTTSTRLGDYVKPLRQRGKTAMDIYAIGEIAQIPVISDHIALSSTLPHHLVLTPFPKNSHAAYIKEMFKYFRGGVKVLLKFYCSPLMSARVQISLRTTGVLSTQTEALGDLMSWVVTVKGSQEWCYQIPYLQSRAWQSTSMNDYVSPVLSVSLLDALPQPYDKPVVLHVQTFVSAGDDLQLAGLESFVPAILSPEGEFQSVRSSMASALKIGDSRSHKYQGKQLTTIDICGRFGSRDSGPENYFPFPLKITDWVQAYKLDNFDYVAQLYAFYTGDTHVKMLFTEAPASGNISVALGNSKRVALYGDKFKAGNSIVVTNQLIWPVAEFTFPYLCEDEFNSIYYPVGMYPQDYDWSLTVSKYLIAATPEFSMHYLLPVPKFFKEAKPAVQTTQLWPQTTTTLGQAHPLSQNSVLANPPNTSPTGRVTVQQTGAIPVNITSAPIPTVDVQGTVPVNLGTSLSRFREPTRLFRPSG